jgi:hypothetical protein
MASWHLPLPSYTPVAVPLLDRPHRLSGYPGKGLNFSFQGDRLCAEAPMLRGVLVAYRRTASGPMHSADRV